MDPANVGLKRLKLRYPGACATCGIALSVGAEAYWDRETKQAMCLACAPVPIAVTESPAGASAAFEGERRTAKRVDDVRRRYGDHAAAVAEQMAARDAAQSWGKGSLGESKLAAYVEREVRDHVIALHDRLIPGTTGNIDHIFVAPTGVWVVDAKVYRGKVVKRELGTVWRPNNQVYVGRRNRTNLVKGVEKQVDCVTAALRTDPASKGTDLHAALCFIDSEWGLLDFPFQIGYVWVLYPGALRKRLKKDGKLSRQAMERIAKRLELGLPPAGPS